MSFSAPYIRSGIGAPQPFNVPGMTAQIGQQPMPGVPGMPGMVSPMQQAAQQRHMQELMQQNLGMAQNDFSRQAGPQVQQYNLQNQQARSQSGLGWGGVYAGQLGRQLGNHQFQNDLRMRLLGMFK